MTDLSQLKGKRIVMTGGAANIGRACALLMARHGGHVVIGDIDVAGAEETAALIKKEGGAASVVPTDVTSEAAMKNLVDTAAERLGGLDVGFFNAGLQRSGAVTDFEVAEWDALFMVNPRHCFLGAKHLTPHLRERGGSIVLTSSIAGIKGGPGMTAYSASKGAIVGFGKALAAELAPHGIRVNTVCPGWIDTPSTSPPSTSWAGATRRRRPSNRSSPSGGKAFPRRWREACSSWPPTLRRT